MKSSRIQKLKILFASLLFIFAYFVYDVALALAGTIDPSFGTGGVVITDIGRYDYPVKVLIQPDGKIVVAGMKVFSSTWAYLPSPLLVRYNTNGSLDTSFGNNGIVVGFMTDAPIYDALLQPDGKFVLVGGTGVSGGGGTNGLPRDFLILRYNSDGTPDTTFEGGYVVTGFSAFDGASAVALQPDGKLLVAGQTFVDTFTAGTIDFVRYHSDGTIDSSFGNNGRIQHYMPYYVESPAVNDVLLLPDGKFLADGQADQNFLARFNTDGSFDTSFGTNGFVYPSLVNGQMTLQPNGKIIITEGPYQYGYQFVLSRFNNNGTADDSFGMNGTVSTNFGGFSHSSEAVLKSNGEIIAIGDVEFGSVNSLVAARYTSNGLLIAKTVFSFSPEQECFGTNLAIQADGKIVLAGYTGSPFTNIAVTRFSVITNGSRPYKRAYDFNGDGKDDLMVYRPGIGGSSIWYDSSIAFLPVVFGLGEDIITPMDIDDNGVTNLAVFRPSTGYWYVANNLVNAATEFTSVKWGMTGDIPAVADYDGDGRADLTVFRPSNGVWYIRNSLTNSARVVQWGVAGDKPVVGDYDGDGICDIAVFRPSTGTWFVLESYDNQLLAIQFGAHDDLLVQNDYDGDNQTDLAIFRPGDSTWYVLKSSDNQVVAQQWGAPGDKPVPGDYDGDNKTDFAVYRPDARGVWYVRYSSNASFFGQQWGSGTDTPVPGN